MIGLGPIKIAILGTRGIPARYGGFETFAQQLAVRLLDRGHDVTVFCEKGEQQPSEFKGVHLTYVKARKLGPLSTLLYDASCLWQASSNFDVVYMLGYGASALCWLPRMFGAQVWINMDGLEWARSKWNRIARAYLRVGEAIATKTPTRIIADASAIKQNLESRYKNLPPCDVIPYGAEVVEAADLNQLNQFGLQPDSYYIVVCRFEPENHVHEIVQGFLNSRSSRSLVLVGDHTLPTEYAKKLRTYKDERVIFTGPVYEAQEITALRFFCRGYLHGHSVGGTNPSLLEAMGCGNVVIAHDNAFNREVLGDAGLFFSCPDDLSRKIDLIDSGSFDDGAFKANAVARIKSYYTWETVTESYCELLSITQSKEQQLIHAGPAFHKDANARPAAGQHY